MKYDYNALMKEIYEEVRALDIPVSGNIEPEVQINTRAKKTLRSLYAITWRKIRVSNRGLSVFGGQGRELCAQRFGA